MPLRHPTGRSRRSARILAGALLVHSALGTVADAQATQPAATATADSEPYTPARTAVTPGSPTAALLAAPAGDAFYDAPDPLPGKPGDIIWSTPSPAPVQDVFGTFTDRTTLPSYVRNGVPMTPEVHRILYHSTDRRGRSVPAYALVVTDPQQVTDAPLIVAMHGWMGFGDTCGLLRGWQRGSVTAAPNLIHHYVPRGYTIVFPDGPGMSGRGVPTPLIELEAARNLLDAAHAGQLFTGTNGRVLFHGHSMGGAMVLGVPGEAPTYAPTLTIAGIVSVAGGGYVTTGNPLYRRPANERVLNDLTYARMLAHTYDGEIDILKTLTPKGRKRLRSIENACSDSMHGYTSLDTHEDIFTPKYDQLLRELEPAGRMNRNVPVYLVAAAGDSSLSSLPSQHAYLRRCARGEPTFYETIVANHQSAVGVAHDTPAIRDWVVAVLRGETAAGTNCAATQRVLNVGYSYAAETLLAAFVDTPTDRELRLAAHGSCRVDHAVLYVGFSGTCAFSITENRSKLPGKRFRPGRIWHLDAVIL